MVGVVVAVGVLVGDEPLVLNVSWADADALGVSEEEALIIAVPIREPDGKLEE